MLQAAEDDAAKMATAKIRPARHGVAVEPVAGLALRAAVASLCQSKWLAHATTSASANDDSLKDVASQLLSTLMQPGRQPRRF